MILARNLLLALHKPLIQFIEPLEALRPHLVQPLNLVLQIFQSPIFLAPNFPANLLLLIEIIVELLQLLENHLKTVAYLLINFLEAFPL